MGFLTLILQILSYVFFYFLTLLVPVLLLSLDWV